ncbi:MAG TPA: CHAP domain-containing protein, partial [Parapedobacter sp.]|nr:CHAP domain-containing protein [Parapedobacter sp.]
FLTPPAYHEPGGVPHRLSEIYTAELGVKEATGNNDGSRVGEYLRYCGLGEGYAWCAAFVSWCHGQAGYPAPRNAWAAALFPASKTIWHAGDQLPANGGQPIPRAGDVFGIYYTNLRRIAHVGFVDGWDGKYCITVEGNTGPDEPVDTRSDPANPIRAGPPVDGVYKKRRPIRTIRAVARWAE